jgi:hypothetical protein
MTSKTRAWGWDPFRLYRPGISRSTIGAVMPMRSIYTRKAGRSDWLTMVVNERASQGWVQRRSNSQDARTTPRWSAGS